MALTCLKQWDMKKIKVIANHIFLVETHCIHAGMNL